MSFQIRKIISFFLCLLIIRAQVPLTNTTLPNDVQNRQTLQQNIQQNQPQQNTSVQNTQKQPQRADFSSQANTNTQNQQTPQNSSLPNNPPQNQQILNNNSLPTQITQQPLQKPQIQQAVLPTYQQPTQTFQNTPQQPVQNYQTQYTTQPSTNISNQNSNQKTQQQQPVIQQNQYQPPVVQQIPQYQPPVVQQTPQYQPPVVQQTPQYQPPVVQQTPQYQPPVVQQPPQQYQVPQQQPINNLPLPQIPQTQTRIQNSQNQPIPSQIPIQKPPQNLIKKRNQDITKQADEIVSHYLNTPYAKQKQQFKTKAQYIDQFNNQNQQFAPMPWQFQQNKNLQKLYPTENEYYKKNNYMMNMNQNNQNEYQLTKSQQPWQTQTQNNQQMQPFQKSSSISSNDIQTHNEEEFQNLFKDVVDEDGSINPFQLLLNILEDDDDSDDSDEVQTHDQQPKRAIFDISNAAKQSKEIKINQTTNIIFDPVVLKLTPEILDHNYLVMTMEGAGQLDIKLVGQTKQTVQRTIGTITNTKSFHKKTVVFQTFYLRQFENNFFMFGLNHMFLGEQMKLNFVPTNYFDINFGEPLKLFTEYTEEIDIKVKINPTTILNDQSRFQFIVKTHLGAEDFNGDESLSMMINFNKDFPTNESFDLLASGTLGDGLIKTINSKSEFFCTKLECNYHVKLQVYKIDELVFLPSIFDNGSTIEISEKLSMIEELEVNEIVYYKLKIDNPEKNRIYMKLQPRDLETFVYVNPDNEITNLNKAQYISGGKGVQSLLITDKQIKYFKYSGEIFYLAFKNNEKNKVSTFAFDIEVLEKNDKLEISDSYYTSGVIIRDEIQIFYLNFNSSEPQTFALDFIMKNFQGQAKIAVKECIEYKNCKIEEDDLQQQKISLKTSPLLLVSQPISEKQNNLKFQFNCQGIDPFENKSFFKNNSLPISATCQFAVALFSTTQSNSDYSSYSLEISGKDILKPLSLGRSHNIIIYPYEFKHFHLLITEVENIETVFFKIIALIGNCTIFFSQTNPTPNQDNYEQQIIITNDNISSLKLKNYEVQIKFKNQKQSQNIFIGINAVEYTILDIYSDVFKQGEGNDSDSKSEKLTPNKLLYRSIPENNYILDLEKSDIYYKNFTFEFPEEFTNLEKFNITVNCNHLGLLVCVQKDMEIFDFSRECDYQTSSENLVIINNDIQKGNLFAISIQKKIKQEKDVFTNFPIDFDIFIHGKNSVQRIELLSPSVVHTKTIETKSQLTFKMDMSIWRKNATIVLTTHYIDLKAQIKLGINDSHVLSTLDSNHFGMQINDIKQFKKKHCRNNKCSIYIVVDNKGHETAKFSLSYIFDDQHFVVKEGEQIFVPSSNKVYILGRVQKNKNVSLNFLSNYFTSIVYGQILEENYKKLNQFILEDFISEEKFEFKSAMDRKGQMLIKKENMKQFQVPVLLFLVVPKFHHTRQISQTEFNILSEQQKLRISLDVDLLKLDLYSERVGEVFKGEFTYYHFSIETIQNYFIYLTESHGECALYLNQGFGNLPNLKQYYDKGEGHNNQIIELNPEFLQQNTMKNSYTIGVYGESDCKYSLILTNNQANLIRIEYQKILNVELGVNLYYFFDYYNCHKKFKAYVYADQSDISIDIMKYDPDDGKNFFEIIKDEQYIIQSHFLKQGTTPWHLTDQSFFDFDQHFILRIRALERNTLLDIAIYDPDYPIEFSSNKQTSFEIVQNDVQTFLVHLNEDYSEADIDVKLNSGSIKYSYSDTKTFEQYQQITRPNVQHNIFTDNQSKKNTNDIVVFSKIYIQVTALKDSLFTLHVKPKKTFKQMKIFENDIVYPDPKDDIYLYFSVDHLNRNQIDKLIFTLDFLRLYDQKIEFLFNAPDDVSLSSNNPFLPMPIKDSHQSYLLMTKHLEIIPEVKTGFYVIKIPPFKTKQPIKISVSMNDIKKVNVNGNYVFKQPEVEQTLDFYTYLPEKGEFRLMLETCQGLSLENIKFDESHTISGHQMYAQEYSFFSKGLDSEKTKVKSLEQSLVRYLNISPGSFKFQVKNNNHTRKEHFQLLTEFKTEKENIVWKDYLDYYGLKDQHFEQKFIKTSDKGTALIVKAQLPKFKAQLYNDHPQIKYISVLYNIYLIPDKDFEEKFLKCGFGAIDEETSIFKTMLHQIHQSDDKNKQIDITFDEKHLKAVDSSQYLTIFTYLKISFIEDASEKYEITLDEKYTDVPFFIFTIRNEYVSSIDYYLHQMFGNSFIIQIELLVLVLVLLYCCYRKYKLKRQGYENVITSARDSYQQDEEGNTLE